MITVITRAWPILILVIIGAAIVLRATQVRNEADKTTCQAGQTLVVNYFAVPHFQSTISCRNN